MKSILRIVGSIVLLGVVATTSALAATNYYWNLTSTNPSPTVYNFTNTANWASSPSGGTAPITVNDVPMFTNNAALPYTMQFTRSVTNGAGALIAKDNVIFDLGGYVWKTSAGGWANGLTIGTNAAQITLVKFISTAATNVSGGNTLVPSDPGGIAYTYWGPAISSVAYAISRNTTIIADDSGGYPITVAANVDQFFKLQDANLVVSGSGTVFSATGGGTILNGYVLVTNRASLRSTSAATRTLSAALTTTNSSAA